ncbi:MAG: hypothetical protein IJ852_03250 [Alphaproteobacteria bacterium]|nr:hypothetical protein [Alphaproteobacteria bacterium]
MAKQKYTFKEKLDITESIVTILMFLMAVWGTVVSFEEGFWHKLNHIVDHYHNQISVEETKISSTLHKIFKIDNMHKNM